MSKKSTGQRPAGSGRKARAERFDRLTAKHVGALWHVTNQAVGLWFRNSSCPRNRDGTYDLAAVIAWREARLRADYEVMLQARSAALDDPKIKLMTERARLTELERMREEKKLLPRDEMHVSLERLAGILRMAGETLQREFGHGAWQVLEDALLEYEREIKNGLGD